MATQAEILTSVRSRLDESTAIYWTEVDLRRWINEAAVDIARRTESLRAETTVAVVAGTEEYTPGFAGGQPIRVHRVEYIPTGNDQTYPLDYRDYNAMDEVWGLMQGVTEGTPAFFTMWGFPPSLKFQIFPVPGTAGQLKIRYYRLPTALATADTASAASTVEVPSGWEDCVVDHVEYKALRRDSDPRWQEAKQEYEQHVAGLMEAALRFSDAHGQITSDTGRFVPSWLYNGIDAGMY